MGGCYIYSVGGVECDNCGAVEEFPYQISLINASRYGFGKRSQMKSIRRDIEQAAMEQNWLIKGSKIYCPECAAKLENRAINPLMNTVDARGALESARVIWDLRKNNKGK